MEVKRLSILDGLRFVAILMVILFHYYSRYCIPSYISYENVNTSYFEHGYLGVELFFIISGFVITLTLDKSKNFADFMKRRLIRLWPAMLLCSVLTFGFMHIFDDGDLFAKSKQFANLLVSNTFINPELFNNLFSTHLAYIDGAYWSLWVEICFYFLVGGLFFIDKKNLQRNFFIVACALVSLHYMLTTKIGLALTTKYFSDDFITKVHDYVNVFKICQYVLWFFLGMQLLQLFKYKKYKNLIVFTMTFLAQIFILIKLGGGLPILLFGVITYFILLLFAYKPSIISFLGSPLIAKCGVVSYAVYLIHQNIGVLIIIKLSPLLGDYNWITGIILSMLVFVFGIFIYKYYEDPMSKMLKRIFL